jgi:hypothetical protein
MYRMMQRILPVIESDSDEVAVRNRFGKCIMCPPLYKGRHLVAVGAGMRYQTLQDKQEDFAQQLMREGDPNLLIIVLPGLVRMLGLGDYGEELAQMVEAIQPPQVQAVRKGQAIPAAAQMAVQQAQTALQALNAQCQALEQQIVQLQANERARLTDAQYRLQMNQQDNQTRIAVAEINASVKEDIGQLNQQVSAIRHIMDALTERFKLQHEARENALDRYHEHVVAANDQAHERAVEAINAMAPQPAAQVAEAEGPIAG